MQDFVYKRSTDLESLTKFNVLNTFNNPKIVKIILTFSFKDISFQEKKAVPFFLALELLTGQKASVTKSKSSVVGLQIKENTLTGCKVTLRKKSLYRFLNSLKLALLRSDNFKGITLNSIKKSDTNSFLMNLRDLFMFYQLEAELDQNLMVLQINWVFNTTSFEKKAFLLSLFKIPVIN